MIRLGDAPLTPDQGQGRQWVLDELSKSEYQEAKPTLIDRIGAAIGNWFKDLLSGTGHTPPAVGIAIILGLVVVLVVVLLLVYGVPRANRRTAGGGALFGADEQRTAAEIRADAAAAAKRGEWAAAIADAFRATARGLAERETVAVLPGTTAHEFAGLAQAVFPAELAGLAAAATAFDGVRYLDAAGTPGEYEAIAALDARLRALRPIAPAADARSLAPVAAPAGTGNGSRRPSRPEAGEARTGDRE